MGAYAIALPCPALRARAGRRSAPPPTHASCPPTAEANFDVVLWASAFVLLSLLINAPLIGPVMRWTGLRWVGGAEGRGGGVAAAPHCRQPACWPGSPACAPHASADRTEPSCRPAGPLPRSRISPDKVRGRKKALEELQAFTAQSIDDLKQQQDGEFLQGGCRPPPSPPPHPHPLPGCPCGMWRAKDERTTRPGR